MSRPRRALLLGFDACDIGVISTLARAGKLPTFQRLLREWSFAEVRNPYGFFVGATWTSFATARSAGKLGFHCWDTITPNYERRLTSPLEVVGGRFWDVLAEAGKKVAVLDVPHSRAREGQAAWEVSEYGAHDRHFGFRASRPAVCDQIASRFGLHPIFTVDAFAERHFAGDDYVHRERSLRSPEEEGAFLSDLLSGLKRKEQLSYWAYAQEDWDFFMAIFGESHAVGHQSWHLHDASHPRHDAALARGLGDPIEKVYAALDAVLAGHLAKVGQESTVLVLLSHGMGPHYDGTYVLEPFLTRLDEFERRGVSGSLAGRVVKGGWLALGDRGRRLLAKPLTAAARRHFRKSQFSAYYENDMGPSVRARQRFYMSPNNSVYGGVRINLVGRERSGLVRRGAEFDAVCKQLSKDLLSLLNVQTGEPVVQSVEKTEDHYRRNEIDELPDLLIDWRHDAPIETVWSPKTGFIHAPYWHWRTGDHRPEGFLFVKGPNISPHTDFGAIENGDLGPTLCALFDVPLPGVDGCPIKALANS